MKRITSLTMTVVLLGCLTVLASCASLGLAPAQTLDQKLAYAYGVETGLLNSIASATTAGTLSSATATKANTMVLTAKGFLDSARALESANATNAANDLALATAALTAVQTYLTANGVK
jgi:hypothetical protein